MDAKVDYEDGELALTLFLGKDLVELLKQFVISDKTKKVELDSNNKIQRYLVKKVIIEEMAARSKDNIYQVFFAPLVIQSGKAVIRLNNGRDVYEILNRLKKVLSYLVEIMVVYNNISGKKIKISVDVTD